MLSLACSGCGAVIDVEEGQRTASCIYCTTPGVVERPRDANVPEPTFVLPFVVARDAAHDALKKWLRSRSIFCRSGLKTAEVESVRGVYTPAYLYSCVATSSYSASIGENYTETQTYTTTVNGKTVVRTRTVTKTEWRPLSGTYARYVTDVIVTASKGIPNRELDRIEPFDLRALRRMDPAVLPGWIAEEPSLDGAHCTETARGEALSHVEKSLRAHMPGDTHSNLTHQTWFEREGADLVLVPVWVLAVRWAKDKPALRVLVNGQTGEAGGDAPLSPIKIALAVTAGLAVIGGIALGVYGRQRGWW